MTDLYFQYPIIGFIAAIISVSISFFLTSRVYLRLNRHLIPDRKKASIKGTIKNLMKKLTNKLQSEDNVKVSKFFNKIKIYVKQSGFYTEQAPLIYLFVQFIAPFLIFFLIYFISNVNLTNSLLLSFLIAFYARYYMYSKRKNVENLYKKYSYRIYRYIHNMLTSGVDVNKTITSMYVIGIGTKLEKPLYELSATFGLTKNIRKATDVFKEYFKLPEVESFCVTLIHGKEVGDIKDLISRQEKTMFRQFFNYVKWETDNSDIKVTIIIVFLVGIICTLISIPLVGDAGKTIQNIFKI